MVGPNYERARRRSCRRPIPIDRRPRRAHPAIRRCARTGGRCTTIATLDRLVATALADNVDVALAVARIEEADAQLREVNAALFPEIDLGAVAARSRSSGAVTTPAPIRLTNDVRLALSTSFEIDFWGRLRRLVESARAQALATHYAKDVVTLSLAGLTTQTYFSLRSLDAQIAATRETLSTRDDYSASCSAASDAGLASDLDLNQALGARADASAQLKELVRQRALAEHLLGTLTGKLDADDCAGRSRAASRRRRCRRPDCRRLLIERRPDIRARRAEPDRGQRADRRRARRRCCRRFR